MANQVNHFTSVGLLGRRLSLDGIPTTVVGILPERIALDEPLVVSTADLLRPLDVPPGSPSLSRGYRVMRVLGRLAEGVTPQRAAAELQQITQRG